MGISLTIVRLEPTYTRLSYPSLFVQFDADLLSAQGSEIPRSGPDITYLPLHYQSGCLLLHDGLSTHERRIRRTRLGVSRIIPVCLG